MPARTALLLVGLAVLVGCGDLEQDRICLGHPCRKLGQTEECAAYVACYEKTGGTPGSLDSSYGRNGTCWTTSEAATQACTAACASAIQSLRSAYPDAGCELTLSTPR